MQELVLCKVQELCSRWEWVAGNGSKVGLHEVFMGCRER